MKGMGDGPVIALSFSAPSGGGDEEAEHYVKMLTDALGLPEAKDPEKVCEALMYIYEKQMDNPGHY